MAWADNFNVIYSIELPADEYKIWKFQLEEHKTKGTLHMNVRMFQKAKAEGGYEGPTKNGFMQQINSVEDIEKLQKTFNDYFEEVKKKL